MTEPQPRPRDPIWEAVCALFGQPNVKQTRDSYNKVCADLRAAHYTEDQILRAGKLYQRDHADWAFTPMALRSHIDNLLHIDRRPRPATSHVSEQDDRPGITLLEYALTEQGKNDPNLSPQTKDTLRAVWKRSHQ